MPYGPAWLEYALWPVFILSVIIRQVIAANIHERFERRHSKVVEDLMGAKPSRHYRWGHYWPSLVFDFGVKPLGDTVLNRMVYTYYALTIVAIGSLLGFLFVPST